MFYGKLSGFLILVFLLMYKDFPLEVTFVFLSRRTEATKVSIMAPEEFFILLGVTWASFCFPVFAEAPKAEQK